MTCKLFEHWANYHDGTIRRTAFVRRMAPVRREVERLLLRGVQSGNASLVGMCRELYEHRDWLWTFVRDEGVEPTNNAGERALRHAVIWRKLCFGTQSAGGSRFVETMLTAIETCRQQRRNTFDYLTAAVKAHLTGQPAPSLLPRVLTVTKPLAMPSVQSTRVTDPSLRASRNQSPKGSQSVLSVTDPSLRASRN